MKNTTSKNDEISTGTAALAVKKETLGSIRTQSGRILSLYDLKERGLDDFQKGGMLFPETLEDEPDVRKDLLLELLSDAKVSERAAEVIDERIKSEESILQSMMHEWLTILN